MSQKFTIMIRSLRAEIASAIDNAPIADDEKTRLQHYTVFLSLGIPTMLLLGLYNLVKSNYVLCILILVSSLGLTGGWYLIRHFKKGRIVYRFNSGLFALLILFMLLIGGEDGSKSLWMYTFPLIAFFLFGKNEGLAWSGGILATAILILYMPLEYFNGYKYPQQFKIRFVTTYLIVSTVTYWFEYFRQRYREGMEIEQAMLGQEHRRPEHEIKERKKTEKENRLLIDRLRAALEEVETLSGLIPICSNCHKIRDDDGYWNHLEIFFQQRSQATFSHGICPECTRQLYPEISMTQ